MEAKIHNGVLQAIADLRAKGVRGIKVELEAQMHRGSRYGREVCEDCENDGYSYCTECEEGWVSDDDGEDIRCEASGCDDGIIHCSNCNGTGYIGVEATDWSDESDCFRWLMDDIAERTGTELNSDNFESNRSRDPFSWMSFAKFYNDGSVDSELTFTIRIDTPENVFHLTKVIESFKEMGRLTSDDFDVRGAGMHMALLFNAGCAYPSTRGMLLTRRRNMKRAVTQLLPALYFLAAANETTREISTYRLPRISMEYSNDAHHMSRGPKYSAISYREGAMEFRVFDTCYDKPDMILDNVVVMANCLKFATMQYKSPKIDQIVPGISWGNDYGRELKRLYVEASHLDVLDAGLKILKPSYYTMKQVKEQRKFDVTKAYVNNIVKERENQVENEYKEYEERMEWRKKAQKMSIMANIIRRYVEEGRSYNPDEIEPEAEQRAEREVEEWIQHNFISKPQYINDRLRNLARQNTGQHQLMFE